MSGTKSSALVVTAKGTPVAPTITGDLTLVANSGRLRQYDGTTERTLSVTGDDLPLAGGTMTGLLTLATAGIQANTTGVVPAWAEGKLFYDAGEHAWAYYNDASNVTIQIGQEMVVRCTNKTGSTLTDGKIVWVNGAQGSRPTIALASNTIEAEAHSVIGMVTADIADNATGYVCVSGLVNGLNTSGLPDGTKLWLGTSGNYTATEPTAPAHKICVGYVLNEHATQGRILVHVEAMGDIAGLDDVSLGDYEDGAVLVWSDALSAWTASPALASLIASQNAAKDPTGFESPDLVTVSYDSTARTVTLTQAGGVAFWWRGQRTLLASPWTSSAHTNATGSFFLSSTDGTTFTWSNSAWAFSDIQVAYILRDASFGYLALREVHGISQSWGTHEEFHRTTGTYRVSGGSLTAGTYLVQPATPTDAGNTFGIDACVIADEDLQTTIPLLTEGLYTTSRLVGTTPTTSTENLPFRRGTNYPLINLAGAETESQTGRFFSVWAFAVPATADAASQAFRWLMVQPQRQYTSLASAQAEQVSEVSLGDLTGLLPEFCASAKITFGTNASYGTSGKCRIESVSYITVTRAGTSGASPLVAHATTHIATGSDPLTLEQAQIAGLTTADSPTFAAAKLGDGTAGAPSQSFSSDTNTGRYRVSADVMGDVTAGVERVRYYADGGVQIGGTYGTSPGAGALSVGGAMTAASLTMSASVPTLLWDDTSAAAYRYRALTTTTGLAFQQDPNTGTYATVFELTLGGNVRVYNALSLSAANITTDTTTGTRIGTSATQKLSLWGADPVVQRASANQAAVSAAGSIYSQTHINTLVTLLNEMRTVMVNAGIMKGSA